MSRFSSLPISVRTDFMINRFDTRLLPVGEHFVCVSPKLPDFYFGNLLAVSDINQRSVPAWTDYFAQQFAPWSAVKHRTFSWSTASSVIEPSLKRAFVDAGYDYDEVDIRSMTATDLRPIEPNQQYVYRRFSSDDDWQQWLAINVQDRPEGHSHLEYMAHLGDMKRLYQRLSSINSGDHWGAFHPDGRLIAFAGLYHDGVMGRFQYVYTLAGYRAQGICKSLLAVICDQAFELGLQQLIIVADQHYHATGLYARMGFKLLAQEASLCWWPGKN